MNRKRTLHPLAFGVIGALTLLAGSATAQTNTSSCGTCGNPNDAQDRSYCDPVTNQCVHQVAPCPPFFKDAQGNENLCQPNYGRDAQTGQCLYRAKSCLPTGCFNQACNPSTGSCELVTNDPRAVFTCGGNNNACGPPAQGCPADSCSYFVCDPAVSSANCGTFVPINCYAANLSRCQSPIPYDPQNGVSQFGCQLGSGCQYTATICAPPSDPCQVLVRDGNVNGCCTYQPRDCAAEYGNNPNYTYSCNPTAVNGVCQATPKRIGPPLNKDQCKNEGWKVFNYPRVFKNQGDCIQFVETGK